MFLFVCFQMRVLSRRRRQVRATTTFYVTRTWVHQVTVRRSTMAAVKATTTGLSQVKSVRQNVSWEQRQHVDLRVTHRDLTATLLPIPLIKQVCFVNNNKDPCSFFFFLNCELKLLQSVSPSVVNQAYTFILSQSQLKLYISWWWKNRQRKQNNWRIRHYIKNHLLPVERTR